MGNFGLLLIAICILKVECLLKVTDTPTRESKLLDGLWNFLPDYSVWRNQSFEDKWWESRLSTIGDPIIIPVPSSYNDVYTDRKLQNFVGWVWYETEFFTPATWTTNERIVLRFESAHYWTIVWVNGQQAITHAGGHLPFEAEVTGLLNSGVARNRLTVAVNNTLNATTVPPGVYNYVYNESGYIVPEGYFHNTYQFDFFNYAGIHRHVRLYTTPKEYIDDVIITTTLSGDSLWNLSFSVKTLGESGKSDVYVAIFNEDMTAVYNGSASSNENHTITLTVVQAWWPYTMSDTAGYMYTFSVSLSDPAQNRTAGDVYIQKFGFREVSWSNRALFINGKQTYLKGINKHEDSILRGKGFDPVLIARDFANQKWLGSNAFRTSHYPYAEEYLEMADKLGIMVIDECPGVGLQTTNFLPATFKQHLTSITEMIARDKNHPSVIAWSLANEPQSTTDASEKYFRDLFAASRPLDTSRPFTYVSGQPMSEDRALQFGDFINVNNYFGWYVDIGEVDLIPEFVENFLTQYFLKFNKPIIQQEYGAGTIAGFHKLPATPWNEEYQVEIIQRTGAGFDRLRKSFLVGEFIWNYADFETALGTTRVDGNKKGIFTRERQPKMAAHALRQRYHSIHDTLYPDLKP